MPSSSSSQPASVPNPLITIRTRQVPSSRASTSHSVATRAAGRSPPGSQVVSWAKRCGGSQAVTVPSRVPKPMSKRNRPPSCSSTSVGCSQALMPRPVAIAAQTSSGVPATSTSSSTCSLGCSLGCSSCAMAAVNQ